MSLGRVGTFNSKPFTFRVKDKSIRVCLCFEKYSLMFNGEKNGERMVVELCENHTLTAF